MAREKSALYQIPGIHGDSPRYLGRLLLAKNYLVDHRSKNNRGGLFQIFLPKRQSPMCAIVDLCTHDSKSVEQTIPNINQ